MVSTGTMVAMGFTLILSAVVPLAAMRAVNLSEIAVISSSDKDAKPPI